MLNIDQSVDAGTSLRQKTTLPAANHDLNIEEQTGVSYWNESNTIPIHNRDASVPRGRALPAPGQAFGPSQVQSRAQSAQPEPGIARNAGANIKTDLHRRPSNNYGHHRQTSVIHGVQHSRNTSFNSPNTASPLSPESLAYAVQKLHDAPGSRREHVTVANGSSTFSSPTSTLGHTQGISVDSTLVDDASLPDHHHVLGSNRTHAAAGSRSKRAPGHHASHSRIRSEARTPGEYALHHLLNAFFAKADHKINQCIANIEDAVAPVEQLCGAGVDASFDQLISALGHISRQEPKALVDSLMLWRKAKGDASSLAKKQLQQQRLMGNISALPPLLPRRNTEPVHADGTPNGLLLGQEDSSFSNVDSSLEE